MLPDDVIINADGTITYNGITFYSLDDYFDYYSDNDSNNLRN